MRSKVIIALALASQAAAKRSTPVSVASTRRGEKTTLKASVDEVRLRLKVLHVDDGSSLKF